MIPVQQSIPGRFGDCFEACIASLLETELGKVPNFGSGADWFERLRAWLQAEWQMDAFFIDAKAWSGVPDGYAIGTVKTPEGFHAVVSFGGVVVHDPAPRPLYLARKPIIGWTFLRPFQQQRGATPCEAGS